MANNNTYLADAFLGSGSLCIGNIRADNLVHAVDCSLNGQYQDVAHSVPAGSWVVFSLCQGAYWAGVWAQIGGCLGSNTFKE